MILKGILYVGVIVGLLSGCTPNEEVAALKKELSSANQKLVVYESKLKESENQLMKKNEELKVLNDFSNSDIEMQAIAMKLMIKEFATNDAQGTFLPLLHSLILAEHMSKGFAYMNTAEISGSDREISKYLGNVDGINADSFFIRILLDKEMELPIVTRSEIPEQIVTDDILFLIDPEKNTPVFYLKKNDGMYGKYEYDERGMLPYDQEKWIFSLIEHYKVHTQE